MSLDQLAEGDQVAIMRSAHAPIDDVLEIATVRLVNECIVQLADGRAYSVSDGRGIASHSAGVIVPTTDAHRAAAHPSEKTDEFLT
jgi:hypothetical protein